MWTEVRNKQFSHPVVHGHSTTCTVWFLFLLLFGCGFDPWSSHTKDLPAWHLALVVGFGTFETYQTIPRLLTATGGWVKYTGNIFHHCSVTITGTLSLRKIAIAIDMLYEFCKTMTYKTISYETIWSKTVLWNITLLNDTIQNGITLNDTTQSYRKPYTFFPLG